MRFHVVYRNVNGKVQPVAMDKPEQAPRVKLPNKTKIIVVDKNTGHVVENVVVSEVDGNIVVTAEQDGIREAVVIEDGQARGIALLEGAPASEMAASIPFEALAVESGSSAALYIGGGLAAAVGGGAVFAATSDKQAPTFLYGPKDQTIAENSPAGSQVYVAQATDNKGKVTYSLKQGSDAGLTIDPVSGKVTLTGTADYETKSSYSFVVVATDAAGNASEQTVTVAVGNLDERGPTITSSGTAPTIRENSGTAQVVYTAAATDTDFVAPATASSVTYSLKPGSDAGLSIDPQTGRVTLAANPNYEAKSSYSFTVVATDAAGNATEKAVTFSISNADEVGPTISSSATAATIQENSGAGQVVYTAAATDSDFNAPATANSVTYSLKPGSDAGLSIDPQTGRVTLAANPNYETKSSYNFIVVATDAVGNSSEKTVALDIGNCRCDDPDLQYLIDLETTGTANRTLKDGRIYSVTLDQSYNQIWSDLGPVDFGKQIVRMASTGGADAETNIVELNLSLLEPINTIDPSAFLDDLACIDLQASKKVSLEVNSSQSIYGLGDPVLIDNFLPSLEKIYVSTQLIDSPQYAFSYLKLDNYGSYGWLPNLKGITVYAGGDAARMNIYNNSVKYGTIPSDVIRGDNFMQSLETIYLESFGTVALNITNYLGDAFMKSLTSIMTLGGSSGYGHTTLEFDNISQKGKGIAGDDGYTDGFMTALEVVTAKHQSGNAKIEFDNATSGPGGADNYMSNLSLIDIYSPTEEALYFRNGGGVNYMGSLSEINMINSTRTAYFTAINTSRMDETTESLRTADNFMTGLKVINIESSGRIDVRIKNEQGIYYLNNDYSTQYYSPTGDNFMSSLENISLDASANNGSVRFELLVDVQDNPTALAAMQSLSIKGGEINAIFDTSLDATSWLNFSNIQGVSDGQQDTHYFQGSWTNVLTVLGGFDTGTVDDVITIEVNAWNGHTIDSIDDLVITNEGNDVRIRFADASYEGSIVIVGAATTFNAAENISFIIG